MRSRRCSRPTRPRPATSPSRSCDEEVAVAPNREIEDPADELLTGGDLPFWQRAGGLLAVVALVLMLVIIKLTGSSANPNALTGPTPSPTATFGFPTEPPVFSAAQALDVVVDGADEWELTGEALSLVRDGEVVSTTSVAFLHLPRTSIPLLALDPSRGVIWLVVGNAVPTRMIQFDSRTLRPLVRVTWSHLVVGAAAVDGYLYLATDTGVAEMSAARPHPRLVLGLRGAVGPIAADQAGHQLIALDASDPQAVYAYRHGAPPRYSQTRLPIGRGSLAVADGRIWVGGYGVRGVARLYRLDPRTLAPIAGGRASEFNPGAVVMSAGQHVIWVRNGDPASDLFVCVDAATGRAEQRFHLAGVHRVASTDGAAVVATDQGVLPLIMGGCAG